jgi:NADH-quinone oxidoreductase subunit C
MNVSNPTATNFGYFVEKFGALWATQIEAIRAEFGDAIETVWMPEVDRTDLPTIFVKKDSGLDLLRSLKEKHDYNFLTDMTATDEETEFRFELVFHLMSTNTKARIRIKIRLRDQESMPTSIPLWPGANWAEREIFDMFGIQFEGHPDLRRILMDMRWEGHPLRKDYPLRGYQVFMTPEPIDPELLK